MNQRGHEHLNPAQEGRPSNRIRISTRSPEKILSWSFGEIRKPETINTTGPSNLTKEPAFCARKSCGPVKDYTNVPVRQI